MLQQKSLKELKKLIMSLKSKLEKMNPDEKSDSPLFSEMDNLILRKICHTLIQYYKM